MAADMQTDNEQPTPLRRRVWPFTYPRLVSSISAEQSFSFNRGFGHLHFQILLDRQNELSQLEEELENADREEPSHRPKLHNRDYSLSTRDTSRRDVLRDLSVKLQEYDELLLKARQLVTFQSPRAINHSILRTRFSHEELPTGNRDEDYTTDLKEKWKLKQGRDWEVFDDFDKSYPSSLTSRGFIGRGSHWSMKSVVHREHQAITQGLNPQTPGSETTTTAMLQIVLFVLFCLPVAQAYPDQAAVDPDADRGWFLVVSFAMMSFLRGPMRRLPGLLMGASCVIGLFAQNDPSVPVEFGWIFFAMWILAFFYYIFMADSPHVQWYIVTVVVSTAVSMSTFPFFESLKVDAFIEVLPICLSFVAFVAWEVFSRLFSGHAVRRDNV